MKKILAFNIIVDHVKNNLKKTGKFLKFFKPDIEKLNTFFSINYLEKLFYEKLIESEKISPERHIIKLDFLFDNNKIFSGVRVNILKSDDKMENLKNFDFSLFEIEEIIYNKMLNSNILSPKKYYVNITLDNNCIKVTTLLIKEDNLLMKKNKR